ncbi:polysaccharide deacetylase family protein [Mycobacterium sp. CBMA271]|uniref:polysaccharide deacetylase family protein n=1 Tax=unclassified Mycobacteroides TaxID=2618759 RepID=UPI00132BD22C|nr:MULTISPECIES: polysaccharide deacetylase family protein [unclassified Mycobacteroides]MUM18825.1 polysaccharide deacetylase [Mycobacteroides sp. CBMA 326]MUM23234.1 polysaccharide deacetylase family protein [Mycobacteroides sp. CBMA 271]
MFDRRRFLTLLAGAAAVGASVIESSSAAADPGTSAGTSAPHGVTRVPLPGGGTLTALPAQTDGQRLLALTLDDGTDADVIAAYTQLARDTGMRLTYFVNGVNAGWTQHAKLLRPLVESGQIQLGNHTWSHPDLTKLTAEQIADQLTRNTKFLTNTYGVDPAPYFRPPYGKHNAATDSVTQSLGYGPPVLWYGSLSDSGVVTPQYIVDMAHKYFNPQAIVIGHLNHPPVTTVYRQMIDVITERQLRTVTLNDVYQH